MRCSDIPCTTTLSYDLINRLTNKGYSGSCSSTAAVTYTYDQTGRNGTGLMTSMSNNGGATTTNWRYDTRARMTSETNYINGAGTFKTSWTYNSADLPVTMQYPADNAGNLGEVVTSTYHSQLSLNSVFGSGTYVPGTSYDAAGRIVQLTRGVGALTSNYEY